MRSCGAYLVAAKRSSAALMRAKTASSSAGPDAVRCARSSSLQTQLAHSVHLHSVKQVCLDAGSSLRISQSYKAPEAVKAAAPSNCTIGKACDALTCRHVPSGQACTSKHSTVSTVLILQERACGQYSQASSLKYQQTSPLFASLLLQMQEVYRASSFGSAPSSLS